MRAIAARSLPIVLVLHFWIAACAQPPAASQTHDPETVALLKRAQQLSEANKPEEALKLDQQALERAQKLKDRPLEALALHRLGMVYSQMDRSQQAVQYYQLALPVYHELGDKVGEASSIGNIAMVYGFTGRTDESLRMHRQALALYREAHDKQGEAETLQMMGQAYADEGRPLDCIPLELEALQMFREMKNRDGIESALTSAGLAFLDSGQALRALTFVHEALLLARETKNRADEGANLSNLGDIYKNLGQSERALEYYQFALPIHRETGIRRFETITLNNMGAVYGDREEPAIARGYYEKALAIAQATGDKHSEALLLSNIGRCYYDTRDLKRASDLFRRSLAIRLAIRDVHGQASTLSDLGVVAMERGAAAEGIGFVRQALAIHERLANRAGQADTLAVLSALELNMGRLAPAEVHLRQSLDLLEERRAKLGGLALAKATYLASRLNPYHRYVALLLRRGATEKAYAAAQMTKSRSLLDLMDSGRVDLSASLTEAERRKEASLRDAADGLNRRILAAAIDKSPSSETRLASLKHDLATAEMALQEFTDKLYAAHPDLLRRRAARSATLPQIASAIPPDTALLDYVALKISAGGMKRDGLILFVLTSAGGKPTIKSYDIAMTAAETAERADDLRQACADPNKGYAAKARALYDRLIGPAASQLASKTRLVICPDGPLWDVPFQALQAPDGRFLLARYEVDYARSGAAVQAARTMGDGLAARRAPKVAFAIANPAFGDESRFAEPGDAPAQPSTDGHRAIDAPSRGFFAPRGGRLAPLKGAEREAEALRHAFPETKVLTGAAATETITKQEAGSYRLLHFATHGFFNDAAPLLSCVVLAQPAAGSTEDGLLTGREIFDMDLHADLVVLSACDTARGARSTGEGLFGLTWALFAAGVPTQIVSQWAVDDTATAALMTSFYQALARGQSKGAALRTAALAVMRDGSHSHPAYWAPFVLIGDWRRGQH